ncbi:ISL3 family transposase [Clostridium folliculivorans]|nr:ISL3 family transposase [Clostridium folliculivorans]
MYLYLDKYTRLSIITRRFFCINSDCGRKIFSEEFKGFISRYQRLTNRLSKYLINIGLTQSANQAYRIFNKFVPVSASSILRLSKNHNINVEYNSEFIGIDDFSFRKGITFGTIICDLTTGKPIDIINSRNLDEVTQHLKLYKNAKIVSRDRSTTYAKAIKDALPNATQVADRFHIVHNFLESICDFLKKYIGKAIKITKGKETEVVITKEMYLDNEKISKKKELIRKVKQLYSNGTPIREIAREVAVSRNTVKKYIKIDDIENIRYNNKPTPIYFYKDLIINLLVQKKSYKNILIELRNHGVQYSYSSIAKLAGQLKKEGLPKEFKDKPYIFTRYNLIKIFWNHYNTTSEVYSILASIVDNCPLLDEVFMSIATLREVLDSKNQEILGAWIDYNSNSQIKEIKSFINGVCKDYTSVANAVIYSESNGILEGNVNRLKYIKRSMFGRAGFNLLRNKVLANI